MLADIQASTDAQREQIEANKELSLQLRVLRSSVEAALSLAEYQFEFAEKIKNDPQLEIFIKNYETENSERLEKLRKEFGLDKKQVLFKVTSPPVEIGNLPVSAVAERRLKLQETKEVLSRVQNRLNQKAALLVAVDEKLSEPFLPFLAAQIDIVNQHLALLSRSAPSATAAEHDFISALPAAPDDQMTETSERKKGMKGILAKRSQDWEAAFPRLKPSASLFQDEASTSRRAGSRGENSVTNIGIGDIRERDHEAVARDLDIPHLVHFIRCENLTSILRHGLMSVASSKRQGLKPLRNDRNRYDGQIDGVSLSITFPNHRMFWKYRQLDPQADWVVLLIVSRIIWEKDCAFYRHNAADTRMIRMPRDQMKSVHALNDICLAFRSGEKNQCWL